VALQGAILSAETQHEKEIISFDDQLAQLRFNLESQIRISDDTVATAKRRAADLEQSILVAKSDLEKSEALAKQVIQSIAMVVVIALSVFSIWFPDFKSIYLQIALAIIYAVSIKLVAKCLENFTERMVSFMFPSKRSFLQGLEQARI